MTPQFYELIRTKQITCILSEVNKTLSDTYTYIILMAYVQDAIHIIAGRSFLVNILSVHSICVLSVHLISLMKHCSTIL